MFCTDKERMTCRKEKMGCEGCYYFYDYNKKEEKMKKNIIETREQLLSLGIKANSIGLLYWIEAINYVRNNDEKWIMEDVYKYIGKKVNNKPKNVERALRTALYPAHKNIQKTFNFEGRVTNKAFFELIIVDENCKKYYEEELKQHRKFEFVERIKGVEFGTFKLPERSTKNSMAYDIYSPESFELKPKETYMLKTGIKAKMNRNEGLILNVRSSMGKKHIMLANTNRLDR